MNDDAVRLNLRGPLCGVHVAQSARFCQCCAKAWAEVNICVMDSEVHGFWGNEKGFVIEVMPEPGVGEEGLDVNIVVRVCSWHYEPLVLENTYFLCLVMVHIGMQEHPYGWICLPNL